MNSWGSSLVGSLQSCGLEDHTLSGCSESSSSTTTNSSSSVYSCSSSEQTSSSQSNLVVCYEPDADGGCRFSRYVSKVKPPMHDVPFFIKMKAPNETTFFGDTDNIFCKSINEKIYVGFYSNIAVTKFINNPTDYYPCYYDENNCGNRTDFNAYIVPSVPSLKEPFYECTMSTLDENGCKETLPVMAYVDENLQIADMTDKWIPSNVTRKQIIALGEEAISNAKYMRVFYNNQEIGNGLFSNSKHYTLATAVNFCDYIINDYELRQRSSSSVQVESSSSCEESSSSVVESSSSSELQSSSSVIEEFSSSSDVAETFVPDGDQTYTPDQIFKEGLQNMESGKCYSLNPERGTINGWNISYNAQDSWWWHEVDCKTGGKPVENGIGVCAAYPESKPTNVSACYSYNGSCYICDKSRDYVDCNADWLWKYNFPFHDWFKQVDCNDPFEEEKRQCPDWNFALKKISHNDYQEMSYGDYSFNFIQPQKNMMF